MDNKLDKLQKAALEAYIGWLKGDDVISPMVRLRRELHEQGLNVDSACKEYDEKKLIRKR